MQPIGPPTMYLVSEVEQEVSITYDANRCLARLVDAGGLEFFFMAQRGGRGFGESRFWSHALDSFTVAAAIAEATTQIRIVSTVHTAFYHPAMVARMGATLDQISGGRWGLNLVSGWAKPEFDMIDIPFLDHGARYRQTEEFSEILRLFWGEDGFDYEGDFYKIRGGYAQPKTTGRPLLFNAGLSGQSLGTFAKGFGEGVSEAELLHNTIIGVGSGKLIGTHEQAADTLAAYQEAGLDGAVFCFRNFEADTRALIEILVPILEDRGIRRPRKTASG